MKLTKRSAIVVAVVGSVAAAAAIAVPSGSAQDPGATTLSFYEPDASSIFRITDNPPKSPGKNPESPKYRFSIGDSLTISSPLFDKKGGTRQGRLYAEGTVVKGTTFRDLAIIVNGTYVLNGGDQISVQGYLGLADTGTFSVVGGTGKYEGARGHVVSTSADDSSTDVLSLLP
jgi:hypothetical protein